MSTLETDEILKERIIIYQHDLICCYEGEFLKTEHKHSSENAERIKQDKTVIDELKRIWYKDRLDGLVYTE